MSVGGDRKDWLATLIEGGVAGAILSRPVADAIGRLIGATVEIPSAGLENIAQRIKDDTEARSVVKRAIAQAAALRATADEALVERAVQRWGADRLRKQENLEAVAAEALQLLGESAPKNEDGPAPTEDFLNFFQAQAENASSDDMRTLFARVLAGECREPGSFSLGTLQVLSVMDKQLAEAVQMVRPWVNDCGYVIFRGEFQRATRLAPILLLEDFRLIRQGLISRPVTLDDRGLGTLVYGPKAVILHGKPLGNLSIPAAGLTPIGKQVMSLCPEPAEIEGFDAIVEAAKGIIGVDKVQIGDFEGEADGGYIISNWRDA